MNGEWGATWAALSEWVFQAYEAGMGGCTITPWNRIQVGVMRRPQGDGLCQQDAREGLPGLMEPDGGMPSSLVAKFVSRCLQGEW